MTDEDLNHIHKRLNVITRLQSDKIKDLQSELESSYSEAQRLLINKIKLEENRLKLVSEAIEYLKSKIDIYLVMFPTGLVYKDICDFVDNLVRKMILAEEGRNEQEVEKVWNKYWL